MALYNYSPHPVSLIAHPGTVYEEIDTIESAGVARVTTAEEEVGTWCGVPIIRQALRQVDGLPEPREWDFLIVSRMVAAALPDRTDLLVPARLVRDDAGNIIGCEALEVIADIAR